MNNDLETTDTRKSIYQLLNNSAYMIAALRSSSPYPDISKYVNKATKAESLRNLEIAKRKYGVTADGIYKDIRYTLKRKRRNKL